MHFSERILRKSDTAVGVRLTLFEEIMKFLNQSMLARELFVSHKPKNKACDNHSIPVLENKVGTTEAQTPTTESFFDYQLSYKTDLHLTKVCDLTCII